MTKTHPFQALGGLGLISYSSYLWHQPVFAFAKQCSTGVPSDAMLLVMSVATLGLADVLESARTYARVVDGLAVFCDRDWCSSHDAQGPVVCRSAASLDSGLGAAWGGGGGSEGRGG